jgi:hypothetical protein
MGNAAKGWTLERRQTQRNAIQRWQPWKKATGPRSEAGKNRVSQNAFKGAAWLLIRQISKRVNALYRRQRTARRVN